MCNQTAIWIASQLSISQVRRRCLLALFKIRDRTENLNKHNNLKSLLSVKKGQQKVNAQKAGIRNNFLIDKHPPRKKLPRSRGRGSTQPVHLQTTFKKYSSMTTMTLIMLWKCLSHLSKSLNQGTSKLGKESLRHKENRNLKRQEETLATTKAHKIRERSKISSKSTNSRF